MDYLSGIGQQRDRFVCLQKAAGQLQIAFWELAQAEGAGLFSNEMRQLCGFDETSSASPATLLAVSHPEDRERLRQLLDTLFEGRAEGQVLAHRIVRPSGEVRSIKSSVVVHRDTAGAPIRLCGASLDQTSKLLAEEVLHARDLEPRDSEARYRSVVLAMTDSIVVHGSNGDIVIANPSAERVLGLMIDQMKGRSSLDPRWRSVREDGSPFPGDQHPGYVTLQTGEPFTGVIMGVHTPDDQLRWLSISSRRVMEPCERGAYSVVVSFADITEKRLAEEKLQASLREKEVLLREIHHRVKNNLQSISSLLYLQSTGSDPALAEMLRESQNRVLSMALVHEMLYRAPDLAKVPFADYVRELGRYLGRAHGVTPERVKLVSEASEDIFAIDTAVPCGLLLNEILSNSFKHAFPGERSGTIEVKLTRHGDKIHLVISDDGVGLPGDFEERRESSLGSKLIERLTAQIGGTLLRSEPGQPTRYDIQFSKPAGAR